MRELLSGWNGRRRALQEALAVAWLAGTGSARAGPKPLDAAAAHADVAVRLGQGEVRLSVQRFGQGGWRYINLHENERTSVNAAQAMLARRPGTLIRLHAQGRRLVSFRDGGRPLALDPNRIFTDVGARRSLHHLGSATTTGLAAAQALRAAVVELLAERPDEPVVALHNNAGARYTVDAYRPGGVHARDTAALSLHPDRPRDAFFLVTTRVLFDALVKHNFNVVLQRDDPDDDGSLAVLFQRQRRPYINVEARFGALLEQQRMLEAVAALKTN